MIGLINFNTMDWIQLIAVLFTAVFSVINLYFVVLNSRKQQKLDVVTKRRSERMNAIRELYSFIFSFSDVDYLRSLKVISKDKYYSTIVSLYKSYYNLRLYLQYSYDKDIELIDKTEAYLDFIINNIDGDIKSAIKELKVDLLDLIDLYLSAEFERLKFESNGSFANAGDFKTEGDMWIYHYNNFDKIKKSNTHQ